MTAKHKPIALIYTILADDKAVAAFEATATEARELIRERWFLFELSGLKVDGEPLYKSGTRLRTRPATEDEWAIHDKECEKEDTDETLIVYLIDLDRD